MKNSACHSLLSLISSHCNISFYLKPTTVQDLAVRCDSSIWCTSSEMSQGTQQPDEKEGRSLREYSRFCRLNGRFLRKVADDVP